VLHHNTFTGNVAEVRGGGAALQLGIADDSLTGAPVTVTDNTFSGNRVEMQPNNFPDLVGGGLAILSNFRGFRSVVQSGNTFSDNAIVPAFFEVPKRTAQEGPGFGGTSPVAASTRRSPSRRPTTGS
jgi:hypothetical protein